MAALMTTSCAAACARLTLAASRTTAFHASLSDSHSAQRVGVTVLRVTLLVLALCWIQVAVADERFALHGQFTYVAQETNDFRAPYRGANSLSPGIGRATSDLTLYLGAHLWSGAEFWANPELDQGFGLDNTLGMAGFPSGEAYKVGKVDPYFRLPRAFIRQTIAIGGDLQAVDSAANQLAGRRPADRWVITLGKFGVTDVFDTNQYAHDPRMDFLNWSALDAGSFDYAADAWGYTAGASVERYKGPWALRAGLFDLSDVPNSEHLDPGFHQFQIVGEVEHRHVLAGREGKAALTWFTSRGRMGLLDAAVRAAQASGTLVDIASVRHFRSRTGLSLNLEQTLTDSTALFVRAGRSGGDVEAYEFTDIDRSVELGFSARGAQWGRPADTLGVVGIVNGISAARQRYLDAGGLGILVGDGRLPQPGTEQVIEAYYSIAIVKGVFLSADYQHASHPAYNEDRGPVTILGVRLHAQF
jgi:high affinity Mn2+ porin